jgi:hypothetical protein
MSEKTKETNFFVFFFSDFGSTTVHTVFVLMNDDQEEGGVLHTKPMQSVSIKKY